MASRFNFTRKDGALGRGLPGEVTGYQAHHILPVKSVEGKAIENAIVRGYTDYNKDFDIDDSSNGIWLPGFPGSTQLVMHKGYDVIHARNNAFYDGLLDTVADKYTRFLNTWTGAEGTVGGKVGSSAVKNKGALIKKFEKSAGETLYKIIEDKIKKNAEYLLSHKRSNLETGDKHFYINPTISSRSTSRTSSRAS